jgi:hypothetical protein
VLVFKVLLLYLPKRWLLTSLKFKEEEVAVVEERLFIT